MIREMYNLAALLIGKLFSVLLGGLFWGLMLPVMLLALIVYCSVGAFKSKDEKKLVATKIARWKWADIYTRAVEKLTGHKF